MLRLLLSLAIAACLAAGTPALAQQSMTSGAMPSCASGDPVVWVNSSTHVYHMQGDSYFGKTKHGMYLCKSAADAKNYRVAGTHTSKSSGAAAGTNMNTTTTRDAMPSGAAPGTNMNPNSAPSPMPSGMMMSGTKHKHHHKHGKMQASPSPDMMPSPAAT